MASRHRSKNRIPEAAYAPYPVPMAPAVPFPANPNVSVQTLGSKNATVAKVLVSKPTPDWQGQVYSYEASESAKREQGDRYDPETGELIAMGRAFQRLGRQMIRDGNRRVQELIAEQELAQVRKSKPQSYHRTREEWEQIQRERSQAGAEQIARNLGLKNFITAEEVRAQRAAVPFDFKSDLAALRSKVTEWAGPDFPGRTSDEALGLMQVVAATDVPWMTYSNATRIDLGDGRVVAREGNQVVIYEPGEDEQGHRRVLVQD